MRKAEGTKGTKIVKTPRQGKARGIDRLIAISVAALLLLTAVPVTVFSVRSTESGAAAQFSDEEIKMASDISNMTGMKIEEILAMKAKGNTWYEILDVLKADGNTGNAGGQDEKGKEGEDAEDANMASPAGPDPDGRNRNPQKAEAGGGPEVKAPSDSMPIPPGPENGIKTVRPENPAEKVMNEIKGLNPNMGQ